MDDKVAGKIDEFFSRFKTQKYKKGEILIRAGDDLSSIFYLKVGRVKKYAISKKGDELIVNIFKPISFFPMSHVMNQLPNNYFYEAMEELELIKAPMAEVEKFVKGESDVVYDLLARVYRGTEGILTRMTYLMAGNAYSRLVAELIIIAKRFGKSDGKKIIISITEKDLANQVGMSRETVSREIKLLKDKGLVEFNRGILTINNLDKLEEELSSEY